MKAEIATAIKFLVSKLMTQSGQPLPRGCAEKVRARLSCRLQMKFAGHWHPNAPMVGNGYRVVQSLDGRLDKMVSHAFHEAGVSRDWVARSFPASFSIWVDPGSVEVRIGHDGSVWSLDIMEAHEVSAAHFLAENDMSTMKSPAGTPVKGANVMAITPTGKSRPRFARNDGTLTDISNVFAPSWTQ
eukprot:m.32250 g.32250  ORF g.32250 m.32250 type:complete len:186 (+) comp12413_c0_seq1:260-817(+)